MPAVIAAVLAGGRSHRMGVDKSTVELAGRSMADWVTRALAGRNVVVVGGSIHGAIAIADAPGSGPTAGLAAALSIGADAVLLVAVDQPWLRPETVIRLMDRFENRPVVPLDDGLRQVTCAVYPATMATKATSMADTGSGLQKALEGEDVDEILPTEWAAWGEDGRSWYSVDRPQDIIDGLARFGPPNLNRHQ